MNKMGIPGAVGPGAFNVGVQGLSINGQGQGMSGIAGIGPIDMQSLIQV